MLNAELSFRLTQLEKANHILESVAEGVSKLDSRGKFVEANGPCTEMLGYSTEELVGLPWQKTVALDHLDEVHKACELAIAKRGKESLEIQSIKKDGRRFYQELTIVAEHDDADRYLGLYWFLRDVSERKRLQTKVAYSAFNDELTDLPNRNLFESHLKKALSNAFQYDSIGVLTLDLDNFKLVNDSLSHGDGDKLLILIAERLRLSTPQTAIISRNSGDEFSILLSGLSGAEQAISLCQNLLRRLQEPIEWAGTEFFITASIGIAIHGEDCSTAEQLLKAADTAMYEAKAKGKAGYALYNASMNQNISARLELESHLRRALQLDEMRVYFQPIMDMKTDRICGAEALMRWQHQEKGMIYPDKFIPIAEDTGLIVSLGSWVLIESCRKAQQWREMYPEQNFVINVNISPRQIQEEGFVEEVAAVLSETGLDPHCLKLEITESVMMEHVDATIAKLHAIRALGVQLALDDFGTGFSSLSYLCHLPLDNVKIDRSFVSVLGIEPESTAIVKAIISMCQSLSLAVTAEGIETAVQSEQLLALGCDFGQGYAYSQPLTAEQFEEFLGAQFDPITVKEDNVIHLDFAAFHDDLAA